MSLNQILLIGNVGRDAELRYTANGAAVANFSLAVNRRYQARDEVREETEWFNVAAWERQAEWVSDRVKRGTRVFVDGRLSTREYTSASGETRISLDVNARRVVPLSPRQSNAEGERESFTQRDGEATQSVSEATTPSQYSAPDTASQTDELEKLPW